VKPIHALPEAIARGPWVIRHADRGGHTSRASKEFVAPMTDNEFGHGVRVHELLHVRFSPNKPQPARHKVTPDALLAAEDCRVNELGRRAGVGRALQGVTLSSEEILACNPEDNVRLATLRMVAAHGMGCWEQLEGHYRHTGDNGRLAVDVARRAVEMMLHARPHVHTSAVKVARYLDGLFAAVGDDGLPEGDGLETLVRYAARKLKRSANARWGKLTRVDTPARTQPHKVRGRCAARSSDTGALLRSPWRAPIDGRVFRHVKRGNRGAVLVDCSGSMSLTAEDLGTILDVAPLAIVAAYSGDGQTGTVTVLADKGRRVSDAILERVADDNPGENTIDGPALDWLAGQSKPRVWISDGWVTGLGKVTAPNLTLDALRLCKVNGIARVDDVAAAREYFRRKLSAR
jgi:hypothetical protein